MMRTCPMPCVLRQNDSLQSMCRSCLHAVGLSRPLLQIQQGLPIFLQLKARRQKEALNVSLPSADLDPRPWGISPCLCSSNGKLNDCQRCWGSRGICFPHLEGFGDGDHFDQECHFDIPLSSYESSLRSAQVLLDSQIVRCAAPDRGFEGSHAIGMHTFPGPRKKSVAVGTVLQSITIHSVLPAAAGNLVSQANCTLGSVNDKVKPRRCACDWQAGIILYWAICGRTF